MIIFWDGRVADWVARNIPDCERGFGKCIAMGFEAGSELIAGVVFHNYSPESGVIEISAAATTPRWMTRTAINAVFDYTFKSAGCQMVLTRTSEHNTTVRRLWLRLGADEFLIPRLRGPQTAEVIYTLTREQWAHSKFKR